MSFRNPLLAIKILIIILACCLAPLAPTPAAALDDTAHTFKMVDLTPGAMMVTNQVPERDPFNWPTTQRIRLRHLAEAEVDIFADFTLQGIIWSRPTPQAIINSQLVTIGDMVDGALITKITQTRVSLTKNSKGHTMKFDTLDIDFGSQPSRQGSR